MPAFVSVRNGPYRGVSKVLAKRWAERMLRRIELHTAELSVAFTNDGEIHELNKVFRAKDRPTDVLAFAMREGGGPSAQRSDRAPPELLGDVVISVDTARRQAKQKRRTLEAELIMLLAHGLLHLVGYDHQTDEEERAMKAKTRELSRAALTPRP
ncbi:MAG TPA: rRNA maturation RNase YbeY [Polyangiaceae bacterium]|nr:rRNA maturation RNase YbeY [Polyangiaceae bacterium]